MSSSKKLPSRKYNDDPGDSKPPAKKFRFDRAGVDETGGGGASGDSRRPAGESDDDGGGAALLHFDTLSTVMEFLHPRDLLNTALACKSLGGMVTTAMVVRSALIHGGHARKSFEVLHELTSKHSIHVPSPLRLLRIANGKRCEFCLRDMVNHVRPGTGVFACWECLTNPQRGGGLTRAWKRGWVRYKNNEDMQGRYDAIFEHTRVAASDYGKNLYLWNGRRNDWAGERVGPLVTWDDVDRMANHFKSVNEMNNGGMDRYLTEILEAPPTDQYDEFNETFSEMTKKAEAAALEREASKRARKERTKVKKIAKVEKMLEDLTDLIDENFRAFAMNHEENSHFRLDSAKMSNCPCICMETPYIDSLLREYIITPSKMKKKTLREVAGTINGMLGMIIDKKLLDMDFLSDDDPLETGLKEHLHEKLPSYQALFEAGKRARVSSVHQNRRLFVNQITGEFFSLLAENQLLAALISLVDESILLTVESSAAVARSATLRGPTVDKLLKTVWDQFLLHEIRERRSDARESIVATQEMFEKALGALDEYDKWLMDKQVLDARRLYRLDSAAKSRFFWIW